MPSTYTERIKWLEMWHEKEHHWLLADRLPYLEGARFCIKDYSGSRPENTDDGILWVDRKRLSVLAQGHISFSGLSVYCPVIKERTGEKVGCSVHPGLYDRLIRLVFRKPCKIEVDLKTVKLIADVFPV